MRHVAHTYRHCDLQVSIQTCRSVHRNDASQSGTLLPLVSSRPVLLFSCSSGILSSDPLYYSPAQRPNNKMTPKLTVSKHKLIASLLLVESSTRRIIKQVDCTECIVRRIRSNRRRFETTHPPPNRTGGQKECITIYAGCHSSRANHVYTVTR
jgi:hypothetical protein